MLSEGRTLTLRKKGTRRPEISAPQQISGPIAAKQGSSAGNGNSLNVPRDRTQQSAATSDLVKRRYSTRFNQLPDFSAGAPPVPGIPQIPQQYANNRGPSPRRPGTAGTAGSSAPIDVDINALREPNLQSEQYVTKLLSNAFDTDIQDYQNGLQKIKDRSDADLQQQVYQNRTQFIKISKEAEKLKGEMNTLKAFMSDLTGALGQTNPTPMSGMRSPSIDDMRARRNANRSSVANLESMWNTQLQALWKSVERSQKFLPAIPGRHIVFETGHWVELDSATWKPKRPVHIVLLNDHLLIASKKRKRVEPNTPQKGPPPTKLVAEECWPLQDIDLVDLGANLAASGGEGIIDERNIGTALNVRYGNKTFTYRHDQRNESAKTDLLTTFRKTVEDLRKTARAETDKTSSPNAALNYFATRDLPSAKTTEIMDTINQSKTKPEVLIDVDGKQQNLRWVEGQIDDLDIDIALHHFEEAVDRVEKLRKLGKGLKGNNVARDLILAKADERAGRLAGVLVREVVDTPAYLDATKRNTSWLTRLGFEDRAREAYLQARSEAITKRARQIIFTGDLPTYIFSLTYIYFTIIRNTISIYQACFSSLMSSAAIKWAKLHLEDLNQSLVRQMVGSVEKGGEIWNKCLEILAEHENLLTGVGLDFKGVVGQGLRDGDGGANGLVKVRSRGADGGRAGGGGGGGGGNVGLGLS